MAAPSSSTLRLFALAAHIGLAACLGSIALPLAEHLVIPGYPALTIGSLAMVAFALLLVLVLLSGTRKWFRGGVETRLVYADILAVSVAPIALFPAIFAVGLVMLGEVALAGLCLLLVLVASRGRPTSAVGRWEP